MDSLISETKGPSRPELGDIRDVSVIIPVYNRVVSLERALRSVLEQTVQPLEILVVDDGSDSDFAERIAALGTMDPKIRVLRNPVNKGAASARNRGFQEARGGFIALLDSDDYWTAEKLERQHDAMCRDRVRFSTTAYWIHADEIDPLNTASAELRVPIGSNGLSDIVWGCRSSPGSTSMFEQSILQEVGLQDESMRRLEDWEWLIRVLLKTPIVTLSEPLTHVVITGKPAPENVGASLMKLASRHLFTFMGRNPLDTLKFLSTCSLELSAANFFANRRILFFVLAVLSFLLWPLRNALFYRRVIRTILSGSGDTVRRVPGVSPDTVVHVISSLETGGAERMLANLILAETGQEKPANKRHVVVTLRGRGKYYAVLKAHGIRIRSLNLEGFRDIGRTYRELRKILRMEKPGVVKCWMYYANILGLLAARFPTRLVGCKVFWGVRCSNLDISQYSLALKVAVRTCALISYWPDGIVANSYSGLQYHLKIGFGNWNWRVWDNGLIPAHFDSAFEYTVQDARDRIGIEPADRPVIGTSARFDPMKGYSTLIEALEARPNVMAVAAGTGTNRIHGPKNLIGLGQTRDVPVFLRCLDIFVLCSHYGEGFSNALLEAMYVGLPIIATDVGDNARVLGGAGLVIRPNDPDALIEALDMLLNDKQKAQALGARAHARATEKFLIDRACRGFREIVSIE